MRSKLDTKKKIINLIFNKFNRPKGKPKLLYNGKKYGHLRRDHPNKDR